MSYFLTRLLQSFCSISLAEDVQTLPPAEWSNAPGQKSVEKVIVRSHLTAYVQVSVANMVVSMNTSDLVSRMVYGSGWKRLATTGMLDHDVVSEACIIRLAGLAFAPTACTMYSQIFLPGRENLTV